MSLGSVNTRRIRVVLSLLGQLPGWFMGGQPEGSLAFGGRCGEPASLFRR